MKALFVVGLAVIILGILSFFIAIPHSENHGIKAGDVIIAVDTEKVDSGRALMRALSSKTEGVVPFKIVRNHTEQTINVTIEKREPPAPRRRAIATTRWTSTV